MTFAEFYANRVRELEYALEDCKIEVNEPNKRARLEKLADELMRRWDGVKRV